MRKGSSRASGGGSTAAAWGRGHSPSSRTKQPLKLVITECKLEECASAISVSSDGMKSGPLWCQGNGRSFSCDLARPWALSREVDVKGASAGPCAWCPVCEGTPRTTQNPGVGHQLWGLRKVILEP